MPDNGQNLNREVSNNKKETAPFPLERRSIWLFYAGTFFYWMAMYFYVPVLPVYAESLGASLEAVGIIVAAYALPQFLLRIPLGIWSDYLGRQKPIIIGGGIMLLLGSAGLELSPTPLFLGISRTLVGIGAAAWVVFPVYLVAFYTSDKTDQPLGILNFVTGAALVATTVLGGITADIYGEKTAFMGAFILAGIAILSILFTKEKSTSITRTGSWHDIGQVAHRPLLITVSIMGFLLFFADFASVWGFVPVYAKNIGATDTVLGILSMLVTGGAMAGSLAVPSTVKRWGHIRLIIIWSVLLGLSLLAIPIIHNVVFLCVALAVHGLGYGALSTQLMILSIHNVAPQQRATAMGFYQSIYALGMLMGPLIAGFLSDHYGLPVVFYLSGVLCLIVIGLAYLPVLPRKNI